MKTMQTIRKLSCGRIFPIVGKEQTTICGMFYSKRLRDLHGVIKFDLSHWSDVDLVASNMLALASGKYSQVSLSQCKANIEAVPYLGYGAHNA